MTELSLTPESTLPLALAEGLSTREISRRLQIKPSGVRAHISALVHKLGAADRDEAVALFRESTAG